MFNLTANAVNEVICLQDRQVRWERKKKTDPHVVQAVLSTRHTSR